MEGMGLAKKGKEEEWMSFGNHVSLPSEYRGDSVRICENLCNGERDTSENSGKLIFFFPLKCPLHSLYSLFLNSNLMVSA